MLKYKLNMISTLMPSFARRRITSSDRQHLLSSPWLSLTASVPPPAVTSITQSLLHCQHYYHFYACTHMQKPHQQPVLLLILTLYGQYMGQPAISQHLQLRIRKFCWSNVYCCVPLLVATSTCGLGRQMLDFSSTVLLALPVYHVLTVYRDI